ncbi:SdiA-regulated domain-containing protein [Arcobacter arenosus]|jgi:uncharacterized protein YjiK|uniref:Uncharacterized protein n=2 Tax=Arcobacter arenosus TaxID=2576037 RepID=A0A5R8Y5R1_9BACT|nr:hypothetical protein FDK22_03820 [Arcobacter arenosus]
MKMKRILLIILIFSGLVQNMLAKEIIISKIQEASGITYSEKSNTLFVVADEGSIYELTLEGKILRQKEIGKYDFEGVAVDDKKDILLVAIEGKDKILVLSKKNFKKKKEISIKREFNGIKVLKKGDDGIEAIAILKDKIYLSNQSDKPYPKEDSSVIVVIDYDLKKKKQKIKEIINHGYKDIAGLTFYKNNLFMVSDDHSLLIEYDLKKQKTKKEYKLTNYYAQEGITFDKKGNLYIADDGGNILKIKDFKK